MAARYESFSAAAEVLFITSSAVSHQIKNLEKELGISLFARTARELKLSNAGRSLYDEIDPLIDQVDAVVGRLKVSGNRQSLRISVQPFFASEYFIPRLSEFTDKHPDIDIQVGTSDESSEKHPADADLSIRLFRSSPANMISDLLFPLCMVPAGSSKFKEALSLNKEMNKIMSEFPIIVHETRPKAWREWSSASGIELPEVSKVTRLDSMIAVVRAAEQGLGAAMVPLPLAEQWFNQGTIVPLFEQELLTDFSYYLVVKEGRHEDRSVATLRKWILEKFTYNT